MSHCYLCGQQEAACGHNFGPARKRELERRIRQYQRERETLAPMQGRVDPNRKGGGW